jgi:hypothetical protein
MLMRRPHNDTLSIPSSPPKVGSLAPEFTLSDYNDKTYCLSDFRGKKVLLNFFCGCGKCAELALTWEKIHRQRRDVQVLGISTINPQQIHVMKPILSSQKKYGDAPTLSPSLRNFLRMQVMVMPFGRIGLFPTCRLFLD